MIHGIISGLLWGLDTAIIGFLLSQFTADGRWFLLAPLLSTFLHDTVSASCFWLNAVRQGRLRTCLAWPKRRGGVILLLMAIIGGPLGMTGYVFAIRAMGAGLTAVFSAFYPAVGAGLAVLFLKQKMRVQQWLALGGSIMAIILLSVPSGSHFTVRISGVLWAFLCIFCWGGESVLSYYVMSKAAIPEEDALFWRQTVSALLYALVILPLFSGWSVLVPFSSIQGVALVIPAGILGAFSYLQYYKAIHTCGAGPGMALNVTYSAWAMLFNIFIIQALPSLRQIIAGCLVIFCSLVAAGALRWSRPIK